MFILFTSLPRQIHIRFAINFIYTGRRCSDDSSSTTKMREIQNKIHSECCKLLKFLGRMKGNSEIGGFGLFLKMVRRLAGFSFGMKHGLRLGHNQVGMGQSWKIVA
ncbi:unnamed protein product [Vicia faba]|uniref:Uncharacterized protein n=1 Tax=Vicia faba TaxID=3906 RepID=A0AAV0ZQJ3_VICFA|nr:unnamed protein product [Vicia faba]